MPNIMITDYRSGGMFSLQGSRKTKVQRNKREAEKHCEKDREMRIHRGPTKSI